MTTPLTLPGSIQAIPLGAAVQATPEMLEGVQFFEGSRDGSIYLADLGPHGLFLGAGDGVFRRLSVFDERVLQPVGAGQDRPPVLTSTPGFLPMVVFLYGSVALLFLNDPDDPSQLLEVRLDLRKNRPTLLEGATYYVAADGLMPAVTGPLADWWQDQRMQLELLRTRHWTHAAAHRLNNCFAAGVSNIDFLGSQIDLLLAGSPGAETIGVPRNLLEEMMEALADSGMALQRAVEATKRLGKAARPETTFAEITSLFATDSFEAPAPTEPAEEVEAIHDSRTFGGTVLVVDDESKNVDMMKMALDSLGYPNVVTACNAEAALAVFDQNPDISLLVADFRMPPGKNGVQLARDLCARKPGLPVVFVTASGDEVRQALNRQEQERFFIVPKPFDIEALEKALQTALGL